MEEFHAQDHIRIGATITVGACLLSSILNDLVALQPSLRTYACVANTSLIERKLLDSELDVALVEGIITSPDLRAIPVAEDFLVLAMAMDHPLASKREVHIQELEQYDLVIREKGSGTRKLFEDYLNRHQISCRIAWEATCLDAIKSAILFNSCVSPISVRLVEQEAKSGKIHVIRNLRSDWDRRFLSGLPQGQVFFRAYAPSYGYYAQIPAAGISGFPEYRNHSGLNAAVEDQQANQCETKNTGSSRTSACL